MLPIRKAELRDTTSPVLRGDLLCFVSAENLQRSTILF